MDHPCPTVPRRAEACFLVLCEDGPGAAALRERDLAGHLAHVERHWRRYLAAGPLRRPGDAALSGSLFLVFAANEAEARALMEGDPYITNGQYRSVRILGFTPAIGEALGGKIWENAESLRSRAAGEGSGTRG